MFGAMKTKRSEQCASDLQLDAWLSGEIDGAKAASLAAHGRACARCDARRDQLSRDRQGFVAAAAALPIWLDAPRRTPKASRLVAGLAIASAVAAAFAIMAAPPRERSGAVRAKGTDHVSFYVKRGGAVHRGRPEERVRPGDQLRFSYTAGSDRYLAILSLDAAQRTSVYYPASTEALRVEAGVDVALPSAVELDTVLGEERVVALFCDRPLPIAALRAQLEHKRAMPPPGCTQDQLILMKEGP